MKIYTSREGYIETDEMTDDGLTREICRYQALAATNIWSSLMDEQRRRRKGETMGCASCAVILAIG